MKKILIGICILLCTITKAQIGSHDGSSSVGGGFTIASLTPKGSPFFVDQWSEGYAIDLQGKLSEKKAVIFDIYNDKLFFKRGNSDDLFEMDDSKYAGFILKAGGKEFIFKKIEGTKFAKKKKGAKYYEIAKAPSDKVIIESVKSFKDPNSSGWTSSRYHNKGGEYKLITRVYILDKNNKYVKVKPTKSGLLRTLKDKKAEISSYISKNSLNLDNNVSNFVRVVEYYHSL